MHPQQRQIKQADLDMLELAAAAGEIELKYIDESGFCPWSAVSYSYIRRGDRKRLEQTLRQGRRLSIWGAWQPGISFDYGLALGSFKADSYIRLMDWAVAQRFRFNAPERALINEDVIASFAPLNES